MTSWMIEDFGYGKVTEENLGNRPWLGRFFLDQITWVLLAECIILLNSVVKRHCLRGRKDIQLFLESSPTATKSSQGLDPIT